MNEEHAKQIRESIGRIQAQRRNTCIKLRDVTRAIETAQVAFDALHLELVQLETLMEIIDEHCALG